MAEKAFLQSETGTKIPCLFNPSSLSLSRSNSWRGDTMPGKGVPELYFEGASSGSLSLSLTFDTTDTGKPVTEHTDKVLALLEIDPKLPNHDETKNNGRPPWVQFHWGSFHSFKAVLTEVSLEFTYFGDTGLPLRAKADLGLMQYEPKGNFGAQNPTSGTPRPQRVHRVQPGETLDRIAAQHYGDPTAWREIALANGVEDPLAVRPGTVLSIPKRGEVVT